MKKIEILAGFTCRFLYSSFCTLHSLPKYILIALVRVWRLTITPAQLFLFGPGAGCRFTPSCSVYAIEAVEKRGTLVGGWLAVTRICRCHPWGGCGCDPVPGGNFKF